MVQRGGLGLSGDSEEGMGQRVRSQKSGGGGMGLRPDGLRRRVEAGTTPGVWLVMGWWDCPETCNLGEEWVWGGNELSMGLDECEGPGGCS